MQPASEHYTVLARRFRPQTFDEVVGQQHVAQALKNAIRNDRVAHAYLFTGARGVGKTSMARILAKALNCPNVTDGVPCNACNICQGITSGSDVDVQEIDGASNRRIDDIRALRANASVRSMRTRYKLYIIDEVHMLVREAFNALLKTLEEPPPGVKFVFCTTEPHKIPDTILSRCQRFDFSTIETASICERLRQIAEAEGYQVEAEALELVARRAGGSMRDSQSLFDQLLAFGEQTISANDVHRLLGTADDDRLLAILTAITTADHAAALREFDATISSGVQPAELVDQLVNCLRDLMVVASGADSLSLLGLGEGSRTVLQQQAARWGLRTVAAAIEILAACRVKISTTPFGRALADAAIIRLCLLEDLDSIGSLITQMKNGGGLQLEVRPGPAALAPPAGRTATPRALADSVRPSQAATPASAAAPAPSATAEIPAAEVRPADHESAVSTAVSRSTTGGSAADSTCADGPHPDSAHADSGRMGDSAREAMSTEDAAGSRNMPLAQADGNVEPATAGKAAAPPQSPPGHADTASPPDLQPESAQAATLSAEELMSQLVAMADDKLREHIRAAAGTAIFGPNSLDLVFPVAYRFSMQYCERPEMHTRIERMASQIAGRSVQVHCRLDETEDNQTRPAQAAVEEEHQALDEALLQDPLVQAAISVFGATMVSARPPRAGQ